jgi:hypothetical protein
MFTRLKFWLYALNRVALFFALAGFAAVVLWLQVLKPAPLVLTGSAAAAAPAFRLPAAWFEGQVGPSGDRCYGKACVVQSITASAVQAFKMPANSTLCMNSPTCTTNLRYELGDVVIYEAGGKRLSISGATGRLSTPTFGIDSGGDMKATTYLQTVGAATGSLAACAAGTAGALEYDTTTRSVKRCDGTSWHTIGEHNGMLSGYQPVVAVAAAITITGIRFTSNATLTRLGATNTIAGTGAGSVTVSVRDVTSATTLCTKTIACTAAAGATTSGSCTGNIAATDDVELRADTSACATGPAMNVVAAFTSTD